VIVLLLLITFFIASSPLSHVSKFQMLLSIALTRPCVMDFNWIENTHNFYTHSLTHENDLMDGRSVAFCLLEVSRVLSQWNTKAITRHLNVWMFIALYTNIRYECVHVFSRTSAAHFPFSTLVIAWLLRRLSHCRLSARK
jgi:hypothetical protein